MMNDDRDLVNWSGCPRPERKALSGRYVRLEPFEAKAHGDGLFEAIRSDSADRFRYLPEHAPMDRAAFHPWLEQAQSSQDPLYFAVIERGTGKVGGRQTLMRIDDANGVIETGHIMWTSIIARRPAATEAFFLFAKYVFDDLGYRRFEWKCNNANLASKQAALRFGMTAEGVFRQAAVVKGRNRDTAWFSIIDKEWPQRRAAFEAWLSPENFDDMGQQKNRLGEMMYSV